MVPFLTNFVRSIGLSSLYLSELLGACVRLFRFNQPKTLFSSENLDESLQEFSLK
jgi:hypothetical protein